MSKQKAPGEYGGTVHCRVCDADTSVTERTEKLDELFTVNCAYCQWKTVKELRDELAKVRTQRDALAEAIDIKRALVVLQVTP